MAHTFFHNITYLSSSSMPKEKDAKPAISATSCLENIVKVDNKTHIFFSRFYYANNSCDFRAQLFKASLPSRAR